MSGLSWLVLLWFLPSFLLHNLIHEGAHALVALRAGARPVSLWPLPGWRTGRFTWAHMTHGPMVPTAMLFTAPLLAEGVWAVAATNGALAVGGWLGHLLLIEAACALVDATVWLLGYWNPTPNPTCDAERARAILGFSRPEGRLRSLTILPLWLSLVLVAVIMLR